MSCQNTAMAMKELAAANRFIDEPTPPVGRPSVHLESGVRGFHVRLIGTACLGVVLDGALNLELPCGATTSHSCTHISPADARREQCTEATMTYLSHCATSIFDDRGVPLNKTAIDAGGALS
jgi:hypothetical protein